MILIVKSVGFHFILFCCVLAHVYLYDYMTIACPFACYTIVKLVFRTSTKAILGSMSAVAVDNTERESEFFL